MTERPAKYTVPGQENVIRLQANRHNLICLPLPYKPDEHAGKPSPTILPWSNSKKPKPPDPAQAQTLDAWDVSTYEINERPDDKGAASDAPEPTQKIPTPRRDELVAGLQNALAVK